MRPVSGLERIWLAARQVAPPFANQLVLEGDGTPSPPQGWPALLEGLIQAQPGLAMRLRGMLGSMRWVPGGPPPAVLLLDGTGWDGMGPGGAPFLEAPLHPGRGPLYQIVILEGQPTRVVLRSLNAATDGAGMLLFARGLFAALRGDQPPVADMGPTTDEQLAASLGVEPTPPPPQDSASPTGPAAPNQQGCTWARVRVPRSSNVVPRLAVALARSAETAGRGRPLVFRVDVPVDLRRWAPQLRSSANLSGWMQLPVHLHLGAEDPVQALRYVMNDGLQRKAAASQVRGAGFARRTPLPVLAWMGRRLALQSLREGRYGTSAVISNLGRIDPAELSGGGFSAARAFFVPPGGPGQPAFITTVTGPEGLELCLAMPRALASGGRLNKLLDDLRRSLAP
jgi:hypothetical protein